MSTQPEALRLADELIPVWDKGYIEREDIEEAAAELRRLHAINGELLEALKELLWSHEVGVHMSGRGLDKACAAIAKATGEAA